MEMGISCTLVAACEFDVEHSGWWLRGKYVFQLGASN
jgi:hypothetical protein